MAISVNMMVAVVACALCPRLNHRWPLANLARRPKWALPVGLLLPLIRFGRAELVTLRQTFVRRGHLGWTAKRAAPFLKERDGITVRDAVSAAAGRRILGAFRRCGAVIP